MPVDIERITSARARLSAAARARDRAAAAVLDFLSSTQGRAGETEAALAAMAADTGVLAEEEAQLVESVHDIQARLKLFDSVPALSDEALAKRSGLASQEAALLEALGRVQAQRKELARRSDALAHEARQRDAEIGRLKQAKVDAEAELAAAMDQVAAAEGASGTQDAKGTAGAGAGARAGEAQRRGDDDTVGLLKAQLARVVDERDELQGEYESLRRIYERDIKALSKERLDLVTRVDGLEAQTLRLSKELNESLVVADDLRAQLDAEIRAKADVEVQLQVLRELRGDESHIAAVASSLTDEVMNLRATNDSLENSLRSSRVALEREQRRSTLPSADADKVTNLQKEVAALNEMVDAYKDSEAAAESRITQLEHELDDLSRRLAFEQEALKDAQAEADAARAAVANKENEAAAAAAAAAAAPSLETLAELSEQGTYLSTVIARLQGRVDTALAGQARLESHLTAIGSTSTSSSSSGGGADSSSSDAATMAAQVRALEAEVQEQAYLVQLIAAAVQTGDLDAELGGPNTPVRDKVETLATRLAARLEAPPVPPPHVDAEYADVVAGLEARVAQLQDQLATERSSRSLTAALA